MSDSFCEDGRKGLIIFISYNSYKVLGYACDSEAIVKANGINMLFDDPLSTTELDLSLGRKEKIYPYTPETVEEDLGLSESEIKLAGMTDARKQRKIKDDNKIINDMLSLEMDKIIIDLCGKGYGAKKIYRSLPDHIRAHYQSFETVKYHMRRLRLKPGTVPSDMSLVDVVRSGRKPGKIQIKETSNSNSKKRDQQVLDELYKLRLGERTEALKHPDKAYDEAKHYLTQTRENLWIMGGAGTGKTTLINDFVKNSDEKIIICAPSWKAAGLYKEGITIHRAFGLKCKVYDIDDEIKISQSLTDITTVIIDEIGQSRSDVINQVCKVVKNKGIRLIVVGDLGQISPVVTDRDEEAMEQYRGIYAFDAPLWDSMGFHVIKLYKDHRIDNMDCFNREFVKLAYAIKYGQTSVVQRLNSMLESNIAGDDDITDKIYICGTNSAVDHYNDMYAMMFADGLQLFSVRKRGYWRKKDLPTKEKLYLAVGMRVMSVINGPDNLYNNGSFGEIVELDKDRVLVRFSKTDSKPEVETWIEPYEFTGDNGEVFKQIPLAVGYAITAHRAQGSTFRDMLVYIAGGTFFEYGQLYVALTRATSARNIRLAGEITDSDVIADVRALQMST